MTGCERKWGLLQRVPRPCVAVLWRDRAGILTVIGSTRSQELKIPTLPQGTREGWGTPRHQCIPYGACTGVQSLAGGDACPTCVLRDGEFVKSNMSSCVFAYSSRLVR